MEYDPRSVLTVFNRWGDQVYQSADYKNDWDGNNLKEGICYYMLDVCGTGNKVNGFVALFR